MEPIFSHANAGHDTAVKHHHSMRSQRINNLNPLMQDPETCNPQSRIVSDTACYPCGPTVPPASCKHMDRLVQSFCPMHARAAHEQACQVHTADPVGDIKCWRSMYDLLLTPCVHIQASLYTAARQCACNSKFAGAQGVWPQCTLMCMLSHAQDAWPRMFSASVATTQLFLMALWDNDSGTHPGEAPAISFRVGGISQLPTGTGPHDHLLDVAPDICQEVVTEAAHEVGVALDGLPALQGPGGLIREEGQVFPVALAWFPPLSRPIHEEQVRVMVPSLQDPLGKRHLGRIAHVAAARMEAHDHLDLEPQGLDQVEELAVACPVVSSRLPFYGSPLHGHTLVLIGCQPVRTVQALHKHLEQLHHMGPDINVNSVTFILVVQNNTASAARSMDFCLLSSAGQIDDRCWRLHCGSQPARHHDKW